MYGVFTGGAMVELRSIEGDAQKGVSTAEMIKDMNKREFA